MNIAVRFTCFRIPGRRRKGFALLEVLISAVVLAIALSTLMRSFTLSMNAVRKNDVITQGCILAEGLMQNLEISPPTSRKSSGTFEEEGFPEYSYDINFKEEVPSYKNLPKGVKLEAPVPIRTVNVLISYTGKNSTKSEPITSLDLILPPIERWKFESKFLNELFDNSPRMTGGRKR